MVSKGDSAGNIAKAFFRASYTEVLIEGLGAIDRGLLGAQTAAHIVSRAVALEAAVICTARTAGWIVRTVTFDHVVFDQRAASPTIKRQIRILAVIDAVIS